MGLVETKSACCSLEVMSVNTVLISYISVVIVSLCWIFLLLWIVTSAACVSASGTSYVSSFSKLSLEERCLYGGVFSCWYNWVGSLSVSMLTLSLLISTSSTLLLLSVWLSVIVSKLSASISGIVLWFQSVNTK